LISAKEALAKSRKLLARVTSDQRTIELLKDLPQGHGSGLDADMVDGLHAVEIIAKARIQVVGGGGSGSGSGDAISIRGKTVDDAEIGDGKVLTYVESSGKIEYSTPAGSGDMTKAAYATASASKVDTALNAEKLEGSTKAQVQTHAPASHGNEVHSSTFITQGPVDTHAALTTGVHGVGAGTVAKVADIATDGNLSAAAQDAISKKHAANGDTDLDGTFEATFEKVANKGAAAGYCPLVSSVVPLANLPATLTGKDADTLDGNEATAFAVAAKGVTNGDSHDHVGGDGAQINHTGLSNIGTNTHAQVDTHLAAASPHSGHELTANKNAANGYAGLSAGSKVAAAQMAVGTIITTLTVHVPNTLTTGQKLMRLLAPCALTLTKVRLVVDTAPTGANLIVDVHTGTGAGTTIFTTQANRPTVTAGNKTAVSAAPDVTSIAEGDEFSVYIDQIGSTIAGADLTIEIIGAQAVAFS